MKVAGIDVGAKGALAIVTNDSLCYSLYETNGLDSYIKLLEDEKPSLVIVEKVGAMPNQGVVSMFNFGAKLGELEGMLRALRIPYQLVAPKIWQKALGIPPKSDKKYIADVVKKLYPKANLYTPRGRLIDGLSDAIALAHYARIVYEK